MNISYNWLKEYVLSLIHILGSHTVVELQNSGYEVIIIDNLSNSSADVVDNIETVSYTHLS